MKWFKDMKISSKLILGFAIVAIIAGIVGGIGIKNIREIYSKDEFLYENVTVPLGEISTISKLYQNARVLTREMIMASDKSEIEAKYQEITTISTEMNTLSEHFNKTIVAPEIRKAYEDWQGIREEYKSYLGEYYKLCLENKDDEAYAFCMNQFGDVEKRYSEALDNLVNLKEEAGEKQANDNAATAKKSTILMLGVIAVGMITAVLLGVYISGVIGKPIKKLSIAAEKIADGDLNVEVDVDSKDEVGSLAKSFRIMADSLNEVLTNINEAADQVASGSKQISDTSMALSDGASEQASSVEELSASMEEVAAQTTQNADNAEKAYQLAEFARKNAENGNDQMKYMLKAMDDINDSSNNISKIIKVIDDIAFQTNILALNAAVEAARAGQHGKGFAVVAEEVRNLAAKSAKAAKETTDLIEGSVKKVEDGTKIANKTADSLTKIVDNSAQVATLVGQIATASSEQSVGISQVNMGIIQISDVVQMNSATSEESAAASEELFAQASTLKDQVAKFKLKTI